MSVTFRSIPLEEGVFLVATDAAWSNRDDLRSQGGHMLLFADKELER